MNWKLYTLPSDLEEWLDAKPSDTNLINEAGDHLYYQTSLYGIGNGFWVLSTRLGDMYRNSNLSQTEIGQAKIWSLSCLPYSSPLSKNQQFKFYGHLLRLGMRYAKHRIAYTRSIYKPWSDEFRWFYAGYYSYKMLNEYSYFRSRLS